ncbi:DUF397 domain-containing protein [Actinomadura roseirufa]|uniref:DUF397 domain-containing protein n=1 Tax=Actinomadura roseirufa TaxID=2094049 RepID=UPI001040F437|nr:DUF397 domain-containing protein [Actinomadura roseirufa]
MSFDATTPARWRRSARCGASNGCVEVARNGGGTVAVRDGVRAADGGRERLVFDAAEWRRFTIEAKDGRFDRI